MSNDNSANRSAAERVDWLHGIGSSRTDKLVVRLAVAVALAVLALGWLLDADGMRSSWVGWRLALAIVLVVDVVGGIVANATDAAKRLYHGPLPAGANTFQRLVHHHVGFTALHLHPIVVGLAFPGEAWWWGTLWYAWALVGVLAVRRSAPVHARPIAFAVVALGVVAAPMIPAPAGFAWFPAALLLKLVLAHAVDEAPAEPAQSR